MDTRSRRLMAPLLYTHAVLSVVELASSVLGVQISWKSDAELLVGGDAEFAKTVATRCSLCLLTTVGTGTQQLPSPAPPDQLSLPTHIYGAFPDNL